MEKIIEKTILVVEDERPLLQAIKKKLEMDSFDVVSSRSIEQAKDFMQEIDTISAIWLDHYVLGKENGLDFVAWVKSHSAYKDLPVFVVSNTASPDKRQAYIEFGATEYYTKADHRLEEIVERISQSIKAV